MQFRFLAKLGGMAVLALVLLIPVAMIRDLVSERQARRNQAVQEIAQGWGGAQSVAGPYLAVPYRRTWIETRVETVDGKRRELHDERTELGQLRLPVDEVAWTVDAATSEKSRGIYRARLYAATIRAEGLLTVPGPPYAQAEGRYEWFAPRFVVGISDPGGIRRASNLSLGGETVAFAPGTLDPAVANGIHAVLGAPGPVGRSQVRFRFTLELAGAERLALVPLAHETAVAMIADWPHPSFQGRFLPVRHDIGAGGFKASWTVSRLAAQSAERLRACSRDKGCQGFGDHAIVVSLVEPVGTYPLLERTSKYGFLFIGLVFAAFSFFEVLRRLAIHPLHYLLVGLALAMFFLLVTALSEHMAFGVAYAAGASSCVALISAYLHRVLRSAAAGLAFGAGLAVLYGVLYLLLRSEDHALLGGSVLLFALLAGVMLGTRRVDWYALLAVPAARGARAVDQ